MAKTPGYVDAKDGWPARMSGLWAKEKLYYVERYFTIFNKGMQKKWPRRAYVDLMAGPGRCITESGDEFAGSPVLAARSEPQFEKCVFVEKEPVLQRALVARTADFKDRVRVLAGSCNDADVIGQIRRDVSVSALSITFVDMLGLEVWFSTLDALTADRRMDLLITLQVNDLTRNAVSASVEDQDPDRFDRFFGSSEWRRVVSDCSAKRTANTDVATALTEFYTQRLRTIGYPYVHELHVLMKNTKNAPLYRLVLAAKHERAVDFFQSIAEIEHSGQRGLSLE